MKRILFTVLLLAFTTNVCLADDRNSTQFKRDPTTGSIASVDYPHLEIHSGSAYNVHDYDLTLAADENLNVCFTTPDTSKWFHLTVGYSCSLACTAQILSGSTVTANSGTETAPMNHNGNSSKTSTAYDLQTVPVINSVSIGATITVDGTELHGEVIGAAKSQGGTVGGGERHEYILEQGVTHCIRLLRDSTVGNSISSLEVNWYEHTN